MPRTLIVDDDAVHASMLVEGLVEVGWEAEAATGVVEAIARLRVLHHGLVVSDIRMNDGDGFDLLRWIREEGDRIPVILMSSFGTGATPRQAQEAGAYAYLPKPFPLRELVALVERAHAEAKRADGS